MNLVKILLSPKCMITSLLQFTYRKMSKILMKWLQKPSPAPHTKPLSNLLIYFLSLLNVQPYQIILLLLIQYMLMSFQCLYTPFPFPSCLSKSSLICEDWAQKQSQVEMIALLRTLWGVIIYMISFPYSTNTVSWPFFLCFESLPNIQRLTSSLVSCILSSLQIVDSHSKFLLKYLAQPLH